MPNNTIYNDTINNLEEEIGHSFIDREEMAKQLQEAWQRDTSTGKVDYYLSTYREVFRGVLKTWSEKEFSRALNTCSEKMPDIKKCLLKTDEALKMCAMSLIPELRDNEDVLSHMTFGVIDSNRLKDEFVDIRRKHLTHQQSENAMRKRQADAYDKYKEAWQKTTTRNITEVVHDKEALGAMSADEKMNYALALKAYRDDTTSPRPLDTREKDLIDDALSEWGREIGCQQGQSLEEFVAGHHFAYAQKFNENEWFDNAIGDAIRDFNTTQNPAAKEIAKYKETVEIAEEIERLQEENAHNEMLTEETAERNKLLEEIEGINEVDPLDALLGKMESNTEQREIGIGSKVKEAEEKRKLAEEEEARKRAEAKEAQRVKERTVNNAGVTDETVAAVNDFFAQEPQWQEEAKKAAERAQQELERKKAKEHTIKNAGVTDETAEMFGDFFKQEELKEDLKEPAKYKAQRYLEEQVKGFNKRYPLQVKKDQAQASGSPVAIKATLSKDRMLSSVVQLSNLMIKAREEKERFLSKEGVVVIKNGQEKYYEAKEYFKDFIAEANKNCANEVMKIEEERQRAKQEFDQLVAGLEKNSAIFNTKEELEQAKLDAENVFKEKNVDLNKSVEKAKEILQETLSSAQGGIVIEKNGEDKRQYKASRYYETHETQKEQHVYGEYQKMFSGLYIKACQSAMEQNYLTGQPTDFAKVAKDVDKMFKSAMYVSDIFDNNKNVELIQKCSFGGFSAEKLSSFVMESKEGNWKLNQSSEEAWAKQKTQAKKIYAQWEKDEKINPAIKPADRIKNVLNTKKAGFENGKISRKELLDYMIAADAHLQKNYSTRGSRFFSFIQYNREKNALTECRNALGLHSTDTLRVAMNGEYTKIAQNMSKEQVFKSIEKTVNNAPDFKEEKEALAKEHKAVQDKIIEEKKAELEHLKSIDKEPITITELDERKTILTQTPRVQPVTPPLTTQKSLNISQ